MNFFVQANSQLGLKKTMGNESELCGEKKKLNHINHIRYFKIPF